MPHPVGMRRTGGGGSGHVCKDEVAEYRIIGTLETNDVVQQYNRYISNYNTIPLDKISPVPRVRVNVNPI